MHKCIRSLTVSLLLMVWGCGEHIPVENDDPTIPSKHDFGEEQFIPGPYYYDNGIQTFLLQSDRVISVLFDSTAANSQLQQVAVQFELLLFPGLERPAEVDWDTEKRRTSIWVVPEEALINDYYTIFPRTEDDASFFGWHPLVRKSFPSYADQELVSRYLIDDRFLGFTSPEVSREVIEQWNGINGVETINERTVADTVEFTMRITGDSQRQTIEMANDYHRSQYFQFALPDFIVMEFND